MRLWRFKAMQLLEKKNTISHYFDYHLRGFHTKTINEIKEEKNILRSFNFNKISTLKKKRI